MYVPACTATGQHAFRGILLTAMRPLSFGHSAETLWEGSWLLDVGLRSADGRLQSRVGGSFRKGPPQTRDVAGQQNPFFKGEFARDLNLAATPGMTHRPMHGAAAETGGRTFVGISRKAGTSQEIYRKLSGTTFYSGGAISSPFFNALGKATVGIYRLQSRTAASLLRKMQQQQRNPSVCPRKGSREISCR